MLRELHRAMVPEAVHDHDVVALWTDGHEPTVAAVLAHGLRQAVDGLDVGVAHHDARSEPRRKVEAVLEAQLADLVRQRARALSAFHRDLALAARLMLIQDRRS